MKDSIETKENSKVAQPKSVETPATKAAADDAIPFDSWFTARVALRRRVQAHHYETLKTFFAKLGLNDSERASEFDAALKTFGF